MSNITNKTAFRAFQVAGEPVVLPAQRCARFGSKSCPWPDRFPPPGGGLPRRNSRTDFIFIPPAARGWEISRFALTVRLQNALGWQGCHLLGDLHGLRLSDVMRWRNCGKVTIRELIRLVHNVQEENWTDWRDPAAAGAEDYYEI